MGTLVKYTKSLLKFEFIFPPLTVATLVATLRQIKNGETKLNGVVLIVLEDFISTGN